MFFDTHTHLSATAFDNDRAETLARARQAGLAQFTVIGAGEGLSGNRQAVQLARAEKVIATVGIHPHDAAQADVKTLETLETLAHEFSDVVKAWGEIGLDYHYLHAPAEVQKRALGEQIEIASHLALPLVIHTREAESDTLAMLRSSISKVPAILVHCFTGDRAFADELNQLGIFLGIGGILTFRKAEEIRATVRDFPRNRVLLETDCPYLAPVPYRGKRNEPAYLPEIAKGVAALWDVSVTEVARITTDNARRFFGLSTD